MLLPDREYTYLTTVRGMCRACRNIVPSRVVFRGSEVWQERLCPDCGRDSALIAGDKNWYLARLEEPRRDYSPLKGTHPGKRGCPHDCGPCTWHASPCQLPVISVTNACNLRCPICFTYNRSDRIWHMSPDELKRTVEWIQESSGEVDLINLTGGEPTLHPSIFELIEACKVSGIGRVTLNSNGLLLAKEPEFCARLAELGVYVILSFDTFDPETSRRFHGLDLVDTKLRAIENLGTARVRMTLLNVLLRGENEDVPGLLLDLMRKNSHILSLTVQTMTYTGQGGGQYPRAKHIPVDEAAEMLCRNLQGEILPEDFLSRPSAHPLCYSIAYLFKAENRFLPFTRVMTKEDIQARLRDSYLLRMEDGAKLLSDIVNQLYAAGRKDLLPLFKELIGQVLPSDRKLTPFERQRAAEGAVRTVYLHAHMDEDTFDCARAAQCPDLVPTAPGRLIPACTYNLFYRQQDENFYV